MFAVIDARSPKEAILNLRKHVDEVFLFSSSGITYNSISGHPDIFLFQDGKTNIIAPNTPKEFIDFLETKNIKFNFGYSSIGAGFESSVYYNCTSDNRYFFHKNGYTDPIISEHVHDKKFIDLPQAYTRCSMIALNEHLYITSDKGIEKELKKHELNLFYFSSEHIRIIDHPYGFFGGTCGIAGNKIFFNGNILKHEHGKELSELLTKLNYEIVCLYDDFLYDGGGVFFFGD